MHNISYPSVKYFFHQKGAFNCEVHARKEKNSNQVMLSGKRVLKDVEEWLDVRKKTNNKFLNLKQYLKYCL